MGLLDFLRNKTVEKNYADSSSIPENERRYYRPDDYYTLNVFDGTSAAYPVITFEERKQTCIPSKNGLYVAEILLLDYCSHGTYPNPENGYPGFWWFKYGIRDVGAVLRSLEYRGFIRRSTAAERIPSLSTQELKDILTSFGLPTSGKKDDLISRLHHFVSEQDLLTYISDWKYVLTDLGKSELAENEYVPYMHKNHTLAIDVWSVNKRGGDQSRTWRRIIREEERRMRDSLKSTNDGRMVDNNLSGIELEKAGRIEEAIASYEKNVAAGFDGGHPYKRLAIIYRKRKEYDKEIEVLEKWLHILRGYKSKDNTILNKVKKAEERLEKAKELQSG